jgi:trimeric autotransporter adhesin
MFIDIKARVGKSLNLSKERKQMSTKTMKQRIAIVAVSALTAGLFSVVSTPAANAAIAKAGTFALAITNSSTGANVVTAGGGDTTLDKSIGFVAMTSPRNVFTISNTVLTSNVATITTSAAHGFAVGNSVTIAAVTATSLNGTFTIASVPTTTTFTYALTATNVATGADTGTARTGGQEAIGSTAVELSAGAVATGVALNTGKLVFSSTGSTAVPMGITVSGGTLSSANSRAVAAISNTVLTSNVATITSAAHGFAVGNIVTIAAVTATSLNGTFTIASVPTVNTFTYALIATNVTTGADTGTVTPVPQFNGSATAVVRQIAINPSIAVVATPTSGATSMTVSAYQGASVTAADPTNGTLIGRFVISLTAIASSGAFSAANSPVGVTTSATAAAITTSVDASTSGILAGNPLFIQVVGKNGYGQALASGTYVATATNGATIAWGTAASATAAGTLSVATLLPTGSDQIRIDPSQSVTTSTTTVTITHDGLPVTTKTLTFYGEVKKIVIESVKSGLSGTSTAGGGSTATAYAVYSYRDSADGKVPGAAATFSALSATPVISTGVSVRSPSRSVQAAVGGTVITAALSTAIGVGTDGVFAFTCTTTPGATSVSISTTNTISLATITAPVAIGCYGPIATYTVSTDKASYAVGEIATITINAKDALGNPVADSTVLTAASVSVGGGSLTAAIAGTEMFSAGKVTVQAQMTTAGKFNTVVTLAGSVTSTATTGYAVTDGGVSNAEVLKSIVALIASINKQISALQKLILRR